MLGSSHHPVLFILFLNDCRSHSLGARAGGKGVGSGVTPPCPPEDLLLEAAPCFVHSLLLHCLYALRAVPSDSRIMDMGQIPLRPHL